MGPQLYSQFSNHTGVDILFEEIFSSEDKVHRDTLVYAMNQLSLNLSENDLHEFLMDVLEKALKRLKLWQKQNDAKAHEEFAMLLNILSYYFHNTAKEFGDQVNEVVPKLVPVLFVRNDRSVLEVATSIFQSLFTTTRKEDYFRYLPTLVTCLNNHINLAENAKNKDVPAFNLPEAEGVKP